MTGRDLLVAGRDAVVGVATCLLSLAFRALAGLVPSARPAAPVPPSGPAAPRVVPTPAPAPLPAAYGVDRLVVLPRDPWWLFAYWEVTPRTRVETLRRLGRDAEGALPVLRLYAEAGTPDERPARDVELLPGAERWYVELPEGGGRWAVAVGLRTAGGRFVPLVRSTVVTAPPPAPPPPAGAPVVWVTLPAVDEPAAPPRPAPAPPPAAVPARAAAVAAAPDAGGAAAPVPVDAGPPPAAGQPTPAAVVPAADDDERRARELARAALVSPDVARTLATPDAVRSSDALHPRR